MARTSVVDAVAESVRADILSGVYRPGQYLPPARDLAEQYGVTRTSLKHAIVRLAEAGLVETKHGVGTRVRDYERHGGIDLLPVLVAASAADWAPAIFEVRAEIGALIAVRAAEHASAEQRDRLAALAGRLTDAEDADAAQLVECEWHRVLAGASGNRVYPLLMNGVLDTYLRLRHALRGAFGDPAAIGGLLAPLSAAVCEGALAQVVRERATDYLTRTGQLMIESMASYGGA